MCQSAPCLTTLTSDFSHFWRAHISHSRPDHIGPITTSLCSLLWNAWHWLEVQSPKGAWQRTAPVFCFNVGAGQRGHQGGLAGVGVADNAADRLLRPPPARPLRRPGAPDLAAASPVKDSYRMHARKSLSQTCTALLEAACPHKGWQTGSMWASC